MSLNCIRIALEQLAGLANRTEDKQIAKDLKLLLDLLIKIKFLEDKEENKNSIITAKSTPNDYQIALIGGKKEVELMTLCDIDIDKPK
ncbi:hypothetical protein [Bartonella sp. DGB1]|uniref:hypothetical protein n=1 Tax=Bartonella sp. DGB1 TaxID=3239807 RepID=UPI003525DED8